MIRAVRALASLCAASCLSANVAHAAPLTAAISVERSASASDCPDSATLTGNVERILQRSLSRSATSEEALQVVVHFASDRDEYVAEVRSLGAKPGERRLHDRGRSCTALAEAVSVAIALLLDKELARPAAEAERPAAPGIPAKPIEQPSATKQVAVDETPSSLELRATFEGGFGTGLLSSSSALLSEQLGVRIRRSLLLDVGFNAALSATSNYEAGQVRTTLLFADLRACYTWGERFSVGPCALLGLGRLRGVGTGYATVGSDDLLWSAVGAGLVAEGPVWGRVFCGVSGSVWLPTRRSTFSVENVGTAWESSPLSLAVAARLGFRIW